MNQAPAPLQVVDSALDDATRASLVFDGVLLVHRGLLAMRELVARTAQLVHEHFGDEPALAHRHMGRERFLAAAAAAQRRFAADGSVRESLAAAIAEAGVDTAAAGWDKRTLRILPSGGRHVGGRHAVTHVHRDSWGSNLYAQVNWWAPVFPVEAGNTILFYPGFWRRGLVNSSDRWRFDDYLAARRVEHGVTTSDYPPAPQPLQDVATADAKAVLIEPGELLCFSAAQLHGGTCNHSGRSRFSIETRTLSMHDLAAGRGAPNIDGHGDTARLRWFRHMVDDLSLDGRVDAPAVPPVDGA